MKDTAEFPCQFAENLIFGSANSAAKGSAEIALKPLMENVFPILIGRFLGAERRVFPAVREMRRGQPWPDPVVHRRGTACAALGRRSH